MDSLIGAAAGYLIGRSLDNLPADALLVLAWIVGVACALGLVALIIIGPSGMPGPISPSITKLLQPLPPKRAPKKDR